MDLKDGYVKMFHYCRRRFVLLECNLVFVEHMLLNSIDHEKEVVLVEDDLQKHIFSIQFYIEAIR